MDDKDDEQISVTVIHIDAEEMPAEVIQLLQALASLTGEQAFVQGPPVEGECGLCHKHDALRPFGPQGLHVCYDCASKDIPTAREQFLKQFTDPVGHA